MRLSNQKTIGLVINSLRESFATLFWDELVDLCHDKNVQLIIYPTEKIKSMEGYDYQHNLLYHFIDKEQLDGVIVLPNTLNCLRSEEYSEFYGDFLEIPVVVIGRDVPAAISVIYPDNQPGIIEALSVLIEEQGCRRIAFFKGPSNFASSHNRFEAYIKTLEKYNIPYDETLVIQSDFNPWAGKVSARTFLDQNIPCDCIFASSDTMAVGIIDELTTRNIRIPEDMKVIGFDNMKQIQYEGSPLASIRQPVEEMALSALKTLLNYLDGQEVPKKLTYMTEYVPRPSSGHDIESDPLDSHIKMNKELKFIYDDYYTEKFMVTGVHQLSSAIDMNELVKAIETEFPPIGIHTFFLALYQGAEMEEDLNRQDILGYLPKKSKLYLAYIDGKKQEIPGDGVFQTKLLLPEGLTLCKETCAMTIEPLYLGEERYGYIYYQIGIRHKALSEIIRRQISTALRVMRLIGHLKETQEELTQSMKMSSLNTLVAGVAHEINSPLGVCISAASFLENQTDEILEKLTNNQLSRDKFVQYLMQTQETCKVLGDNLGRGATLVSSFKNIAADQAIEETRAFELSSYLKQIMVSYSAHFRKQGIKTRLYSPKGLVINTYPGILSRVLNNIIENTLMHSFTDQEKKNFIINVYSEPYCVTIRMFDNGIGIIPEHLSHIFDPFFTTKRGRGGIGLGLNIVYNLVTQNLNGQIHCKSRVNEGTEFVIRIPLNR